MSFDSDLEEALRRGYVAALRFLNDREAARDACQEAASKALAAKAKYDPEREFYPWFYRILRNHCCDLLSQRGRLLFTEEIESSTTDSLEQRYIKTEEERRILAAITSLDPELREIIELRHFQDLSYQEIAEILACPEGTVMSRLYRARKSLRQVLSSSRQSGNRQNNPPR